MKIYTLNSFVIPKRVSPSFRLCTLSYETIPLDLPLAGVEWIKLHKLRVHSLKLGDTLQQQ